jgi:hypothetical protein
MSEPNAYGWSSKPTHLYVLHHDLPHDYLVGCVEVFSDNRKWEWELEDMSSIQKFDEIYEHISEKVLEYIENSLDEYDGEAAHGNIPQFIGDLYGYARRRINVGEVAKAWTSDFMLHLRVTRFPELY